MIQKSRGDHVVLNMIAVFGTDVVVCINECVKCCGMLRFCPAHHRNSVNVTESCNQKVMFTLFKDNTYRLSLFFEFGIGQKLMMLDT